MLETIFLNADQILEAIQLYCDKQKVIYDPERVCWRISTLDRENEGNTDSIFEVTLHS
jgi:hypothetical protein